MVNSIVVMMEFLKFVCLNDEFGFIFIIKY